MHEICQGFGCDDCDGTGTDPFPMTRPGEKDSMEAYVADRAPEMARFRYFAA
jgi:hypothetical protein